MAFERKEIIKRLRDNAFKMFRLYESGILLNVFDHLYVTGHILNVLLNGFGFLA